MKRLLLICAALCLCACDTHDQPMAAAPQAGDKAGHEHGRRIYNFRCYFCHGYSGDARTQAASYLNPRPRDFTAARSGELPREAMVAAVTHGRPGTAMQGFAQVLSSAEIDNVVDFVRAEFMLTKAVNARYHTGENGWPNHEQYRAAFAFAQGDVSHGRPWEELSSQQRAGKRLFMSTCLTCHDSPQAEVARGPAWEARPLSFPRNGYQPGETSDLDAMSSASPYLLHDRAPKLEIVRADEAKGESLYQRNCAFCHAADGTGRNWIGSFLEPHPRDLTDRQAMRAMTRKRLARVIAEGVPGTSMPAWKDVLTAAEIEAIVAYVGRAFQPLPDQ